MRATKLTLTLKMEALEFIEQCGNVRETARKLKVQPYQVRKWRESYLKINEKSRKNPR